MKHKLVWLILIGTLASFFIRFIALSQTSYANGWDAYFYLIQIQSLVETGSMHSHEWTLLYPLLYILSIPFSYVIAGKVLASLLAALFTLGLALIAYQQTKSILAAALIISLTLFSPELTYFASQWPKNLLGVDLLLFLFLFLTKEQLKWAVLFLVLGLFGHRLTAILGILLFTGWYIFTYINSKIIFIGGAALVTGLVVINFLPGLLSFNDIQRLNNLFGSSLIITPLEFKNLIGASKVSILWQTELWIYYILFLLIGFKFVFGLFIKPISKIQTLLFLLLLLLWFPMYKLTLDGAAYRFFHTGALLSIMIPVFLLKELDSLKNYKFGLIAALFSLVILSFFSYKSYNPKKHDPPYKLYANLAIKMANNWEKGKAPELIIAHKSLAEYVTFTTRVDVLPWLPEYAIENDELYRIGYFPLKQLASYYLGDKVVFLSGNYGYLKEVDWVDFLAQVKNNEAREVYEYHMDWKNPSRIRPAFLLNN